MSILNALRLEMIMIFCSDSWSAHIFLYLSTDPQIRIVSTVHYIGKGVVPYTTLVKEDGRPAYILSLFAFFGPLVLCNVQAIVTKPEEGTEWGFLIKGG